MRRGKDGEKSMEPMFPRLHVNDTEKGGPRAPPRNKMALYEQLSIPSHRYITMAPPKHNYTTNLVPSTSTTQGTSRKRSAHFPLYQPSSAPAYKEIHDPNTEALNLNNEPVSVEDKKKSPEEEDFMVPIFSEARTEMYNQKTQNSKDREGHLRLSSSNQGALPTTVGEETTNQSNNAHVVSRQQIKNREGRDLRESPSTRISLDISMSERNDVPLRRDAPFSEDCGNSLYAVDHRSDEDVPVVRGEKPFDDTSLRLRLDPQTGQGFRGDDKIDKASGRIGDDEYLEKESIDKGDDVSETSMVDSASEFDITPDEVVDIIGRKHFWKARTAIVNQQRVFAVQVFELHRLLKVQKLIAGSPNIVVEVSAFEAKSSLKGSAVKRSSEHVVKALPRKSMLKDITHRAIIDKVEATAENAVPKAPPRPPPVASQQHPNQPTGYPSFSGNMDPKMNPWGFHQPSAHQWLVPVMTPSEGLVYKPYPAPGFVGPVCGGCGPVGPTSIPSNLMNPPPPPSPYMAPTQQYQQPMGIHFGGPGYFPPYGMQMMGPSMSGSTVDQLNNPSFGSNPYSQGGQPDGPFAAGFVAPTPTDRATAPLSEGRDSRQWSYSQGQGGQPGGPSATRSEAPTPASGPTDRATAPLSEGRDSRQWSYSQGPTDRAEAPLSEGRDENRVSSEAQMEKQARVIRAVPHRSTNDSAARIFQSIQQERQLYGSR